MHLSFTDYHLSAAFNVRWEHAVEIQVKGFHRVGRLARKYSGGY